MTPNQAIIAQLKRAQARRVLLSALEDLEWEMPAIPQLVCDYLNNECPVAGVRFAVASAALRTYYIQEATS